MRQRRSIRLAEYDYSEAGAYFVTICASRRQPWFGQIYDGSMQPNDVGIMIAALWDDLPTRFPHCVLDISLVMPDHLHGIITIVGDPPPISPPDSEGLPVGTRPGSISRIVQAFKSLTTNAYIQGINQHGWPPFPGKLWQRNYYERVIRSEDELQHTRNYIQHNPLRWKQ